jgi:hypothetical protein
MPSSEVFKKGKAGKLHSGGPNGPVVKHGSAQEKAIYMSEKRNEDEHGGTYVSGSERKNPLHGTRRKRK